MKSDTKSILIVTSDTELASRVLKALEGDGVRLEISPELPIDVATLNKLDLLIWDNPFTASTPYHLYREFGAAQKKWRDGADYLPVIGLEPKHEPDVLTNCFPIVCFDMMLLRSVEPAKLRSFVKRLLEYYAQTDVSASRYTI